jgi:hypothetical protein
VINNPYNYNDMNITLGSGATDTITITQTSNSSPIYTTGLSPGYYNWNTITTGTGTDTISISDWGNLSNTLDVKGDANFEGDVKIKGKSLVDSLEKIEEKLAILRPNEQLEEKWEELRNLRKQYMELEKEIIEKEKVWDILKK